VINYQETGVSLDHVGRITLENQEWQKSVHTPGEFAVTAANQLENYGRVTIMGVEYDQLDTCLVHPCIYLPEGVGLGNYVRLDAGVTFRGNNEGYVESTDHIHIGSNSRVKGTSISRGARIGPHVVMMGAYVGRYSEIGDSSRVLENAQIEDNVEIGRSVRIGQNSSINQHAKIGNHAMIGQYVDVGRGAQVDYRIRVGRMRGEGWPIRVEVPASTRVRHNLLEPINH
jgi:carbonic anhydrase/acetyltransferase-like protein (isoleucine patch superfamily)